MKKNVRRAKEQLENMIEVLNDILEGKLTQAQAAAKFGISPQNFGRYTTSSFVFAPYIKKNILTEKDIFSMVENLETPCEALAKDILGVHPEGKLFVVDTALPDEYIKVFSEILTPNEKKAVILKYGFDQGTLEKGVLSLREISSKMGYSPESVRKFLNNALKKLRLDLLVIGYFKNQVIRRLHICLRIRRNTGI